ncbi:MAG: dTDP-4-dehydrorhamnose reductase [Phycisphaerales bacterium]
MPTPTPSPIRCALVIGAGGMLGRAWTDELRARSIPFDAAHLPQFDLLDPRAADLVLETGRYSHVLNAAGWTDVDGAETDERGAMALNADAVGRLAAASARHGCHLVHISTDYVFSGDAAEPYPTDAPHDPINAYGRSKAAGETALFQSGARWTLARTSWLHAPWGRNFVRTMLRLLSERDEVRVVDDQRGRPTSARTLASATLDLVLGGHEGIWHVTDLGETTWHGLAVEIARRTGAACRVEPCGTDAFPRPAPRPAYSVLDVTETQRVIAGLPTWEDALAHVLDEIASEQEGRTTA